MPPRHLAGLILVIPPSNEYKQPRFVTSRRTSSKGFCFLMTKLDFVLRNPNELSAHLGTLYQHELVWILETLRESEYEKRKKYHSTLVDRGLGVLQRKYWNRHKADQNWRAFESRLFYDAVEEETKSRASLSDGNQDSQESLSSASAASSIPPTQFLQGCLRAGDYGPIKGFVEASDESPIAAAVRECIEETWLEPNDFTIHSEYHLHQEFDIDEANRSNQGSNSQTGNGSGVSGADYYLATVRCSLDRLLRINQCQPRQPYREKVTLDELIEIQKQESESISKLDASLNSAPSTSTPNSFSDSSSSSSLHEHHQKIEVYLELVTLEELDRYLPREYPERHALYEWAAKAHYQLVASSPQATAPALNLSSNDCVDLASTSSSDDRGNLQSTHSRSSHCSRRSSRSRSPVSRDSASHLDDDASCSTGSGCNSERAVNTHRELHRSRSRE